MKERTIIILRALVEDFIETGTPVASKKLLQTHNFNISSATVRTEFSKLEEVGFIESPHISAGKIPTEKGLRFFVDEFVNSREAEESQEVILEKNINEIFQKHIKAYKIQKDKEILFDALKLVSQLSENVAFASLDSDRTFYLGLSNVLRTPEFISDPEKAAQIVEVLEGRSRFTGFLEKLNMPKNQVKIFIGEENILEEISSCGMLAVRFESRSISGYLGILGPMRMKYAYNKALLQNVLEMVN